MRASELLPTSLAGYVHEAALRFHRTLAALETSMGELALPHPRLLEIGSNPYFFTLLIAERLPHLEHCGITYLGIERPAIETEGITDDRV